MQEKAADPKIVEHTYDRGAKGYADYWPGPREFLSSETAAFLQHLPKGGRILDAGCGPGQDAAYFASLGYEVAGFDLSEEFLKIARRRLPGATFIKADMRKLDFPDRSFDGVWASFSFHHLSKADAPAALAELKRVLKAGGVLFISGHRAEQTRTSVNPVSGLHEEGSEDFLPVFFQEYSEGDFRKLIAGAGLTLQSFRAFTREGGPYPLFASITVKL
jgi:ubiquinone/menaquinone biosynthesis C-methylase UbiE